MKKFAIVTLVLFGVALVSSCAASRGGGGGQKCPAYSQTDSDQNNNLRS